MSIEMVAGQLRSPRFSSSEEMKWIVMPTRVECPNYLFSDMDPPHQEGID